MYRLLAPAHQRAQQLDEQLAVERAVKGTEPKRSPRTHRRGRRHRLALAGSLHHRGLAAQPPSLAVHGVGTKARFVPEQDLRPLALGLAGERRIGLALPAGDGLRITLVGALQRLLRRQFQLREQRTDRRDPQPEAELALNQHGHDSACPQPEVQSVLARIATIDPAEHLPLLGGSETTRATGATGGAQCLQPMPAPRRSLQPLVDRRPAETIRRNYRRRPLAFTNPLHRHPADLLKRRVIERATVQLHVTFDRHRTHWFHCCSLYYGLLSKPHFRAARTGQ